MADLRSETISSPFYPEDGMYFLYGIQEIDNIWLVIGLAEVPVARKAGSPHTTNADLR